MARCFQDTCSTVVTEVVIPDVGPGYAVNARLAPTGGLECIEPATGLRVRLSGDAGNILSRDPDDGGLYAGLPVAGYAEQAAGTNPFISVPFDADAGNKAIAPAIAPTDYALRYQNATNQEQLLIVQGQLRYSYDIVRSGAALPANGDILRQGVIAAGASGGGGGPARNLTPYNVEAVMQLERRVGGGAWNAVVTEKHSGGGLIYISNPAQNEHKHDWRSFVYIHSIAAGATHDFRGACFYEGPDQTMNVTATPADQNAPATRGFAVALLEAYAIPVAVND